MINKIINPYSCLLVLLILFILIWYFFADNQQYEFLGLKELQNDYVLEDETMMETPDVKKEPELFYHDTHVHDNHINMVIDTNEVSVNLVDEIKPTNNYDLLPEHVDPNFNIDLTPEVPIEFTQNFCYTKSHTGRFESRGEQICRDTMQKIYGVPFKNCRPSWLKNPETGRNLELDCYNIELKIAVEFSGIGHYCFGGPNSMQTYDNFRKQVKRDELKKKLCEENGVHLIVVPYIVNPSMIALYIVYHLPEIVRQRVLIEKIIE